MWVIALLGAWLAVGLLTGLLVAAVARGGSGSRYRDGSRSVRSVCT